MLYKNSLSLQFYAISTLLGKRSHILIAVWLIRSSHWTFPR